mgnify:CR=1 FL=1
MFSENFTQYSSRMYAARLGSIDAAAAEQIIPALVEQGYKLVTVSEMFEAKGIALENGKAYRKAR